MFKQLQIGKLFVTDSSFGHVVVGDPTFRKRFEEGFKSQPNHIVWMEQIHSPTVQFIEKGDEPDLVLSQTDGLMTREPNVMLITKTADCVPVLLWNKKDQVIAALHCGWKGFFAGILESFAELSRKRGFEPKHFSAFLGPHLRVEHFEVQQDFIDQIPEQKKRFLEVHDGKNFYNLTMGVKTVLNSFGISDIEDCGIDTFTSPEHFSYRRWVQLPESERPDHYDTFASGIIMTSL